MIKVKKGDTPAFLLSETVKKKITQALNEKNAHDFQTYYYGNAQKVKPLLEAAYKHKCCFCERNEAGGVELQIEHYRPVRTPKECNSEKHLGYYWLGYEWNNLLLSCSTCNKHKNNSFPLENENNRAYTPTDLLSKENPLIFNPETDNVFEHFSFEQDGTLKSNTQKGKKTIEILKLNDTALLTARNRIIRSYIAEFTTHLLAFRNGFLKKDGLRFYFKTLFTTIKQNRKRSETHTFFAYFFYANFELFVEKRSDTDISEKQQIIKAYKLFVNGQL